MVNYLDLIRQHQNPKTDEPPQAPDAKDKPVDKDSTYDIPDLLDESAPSPQQAEPLAMGVDIFPDEDAAPPSAPEPTPSITDHKAEHGEGLTTLWLKQCLELTLSAFTMAEKNQPHDLSALQSHLSSFLQDLKNEPAAIDHLELEIALHLKNTEETQGELGSLIQKSIMMMLYAIKTGISLKLDDDKLLLYTFAAMLQHIGMAQVPPEIRLKKTKLSESELSEIRSSHLKTVEYLKLCGIHDDAILLAASQSSERFDGSGPNGLTGLNIAYSARLIGLLSIFEALIHFRPYRPRLLPRDAIREIVKKHKAEFDPVMMKALIESVSMYPVGTYVQLNTGAVGQVIQTVPGRPLRPTILISMDERGDEAPHKEIRLREQPNLMITRCMYEEHLADLTPEPAVKDSHDEKKKLKRTFLKKS